MFGDLCSKMTKARVKARRWLWLDAHKPGQEYGDWFLGKSIGAYLEVRTSEF